MSVAVTTLNAAPEPKTRVSIIPGPNRRVYLTLESRGWILIDAILTQEDIATLRSALMGAALNTAPVGSEFYQDGGH